MGYLGEEPRTSLDLHKGGTVLCIVCRLGRTAGIPKDIKMNDSLK